MRPAWHARQRRARAAVAAIAGAVALVLGAAAPAGAHSTRLTDVAHYRVRITGVEPAHTSVVARVASNGDWIEVTSHAPRPVTVLGYFGEPFLRLGLHQVDVNAAAPTTYVNNGLLGAFGPTLLAGASRPPQWRRQRAGRTARWHDLRMQWLSDGRPAEVARDPRHNHHIIDWQIRVTGSTVNTNITGELNWQAVVSTSPGGPLLLAADTAALAAVLGGAALLARRSRRRLPRLRASGLNTPTRE